MSHLLDSLKPITLIGSALIAAYLVVTSVAGTSLFAWIPQLSSTAPSTDTIASLPLTSLTHPDIGLLRSPRLKASLINQDKTVEADFLVDTGAKITALPLEYLDKLNVNQDDTKRIFLRSATADTAFGYLTKLDIKINNHQEEIPLAFATIAEPLLGMQGFLDRHEIILNPTTHTLTINK